MHSLLQDLQFALRQLRKSPGFAATAILTLALGIGANAAIFTLVHAILLRNLPVADPQSLVRVGDKASCCFYGGIPDGNDQVLFAYDLYHHLWAHAPEFEQLSAIEAGSPSVTARSSRPGDLPRASHGEHVSGNYFVTFGLQPYAGRLLVPSDDTPAAPAVAVMTYRAWQRDYALDPAVIGSTFTLNAQPVTIIGVTPPGFYGDRLTEMPPDFLMPLAMSDPSVLRAHTANWLYLIGRVKPGTPLAPLQAKLSGALRQWLAALPLYQRQDEQKNLAATHVVLTPGGAGITGMQEAAASGLHLLMAISGLVLLIACANVANLLLVRGMARAAETSLRMALGAQRRRILRQMLTESVLLASLGGLAGLGVAYAGTRLLLSLAFPDAPDLPIQATPSPAVLAFAFGLSLATGLLFGLAPAWLHSHAQPAEALRGLNRSTRDGSSMLQQSLVVLQAALSLVLLVAAGLLSKSLNHLEHQDFGLETSNRVVVHISPGNAGYTPAQLPALYDQLQQKLAALPGVSRVSLSLFAPLEGSNWGQDISIEGRPTPGASEDSMSDWIRISPSFFDLVGQRVLRGRGITPQDIPGSPNVAVVNQAFVHKFFPHGEDPLGKRFGTEGPASGRDFTIVGVVNDVKYDEPKAPAGAMYFRPLLQVAATSPKSDSASLFANALMLQTSSPVANLEPQVRRTLAEINPSLTALDYKTFAHQIGGQFNQERLIARLTQLFGALALLLAAIGLYGVTSYTVARRTSEIGVRIALGAPRTSVIQMVLRGALFQAGLGLALGIPAALLAARLIQAQLYGVAGTDLPVLAAALGLLTAAAALAAWLPARRAASIDPMQALRAE